MNGLWADGWFYISSAGLLVSGILFLFLLGQYRSAADAADRHEPAVEPESSMALISPVYVREEPAEAARVAAPPPVPIPAPASLEFIERRLEGLCGQVAELSESVVRMARALEGLKAASSVPVILPPAPAGVPEVVLAAASKPEIKLEREVPPPAPVPQPKPVLSPDETIRLISGDIFAAEAPPPASGTEPSKAKEDAAQAPAPDKTARRGPVWPV